MRTHSVTFSLDSSRASPAVAVAYSCGYPCHALGTPAVMSATLEVPQYPNDPSGPVAPTPGPELPADPVIEPSSPEPVGPVIDDPAPADVPPPDDSPVPADG